MGLRDTFTKLKEALADSFSRSSVPPNGFAPFSVISGLVTPNSAAQSPLSDAPQVKEPGMRVEDGIVEGEKARIMIIKPNDRKLIGEGPFIPDYYKRELWVQQPAAPETPDFRRRDDPEWFIG